MIYPWGGRHQIDRKLSLHLINQHSENSFLQATHEFFANETLVIVK